MSHEPHEKHERFSSIIPYTVILFHQMKVIIHQFFYPKFLCVSPRSLRFLPYSWFFNRRGRRGFKVIIHQTFYAMFDF